MTKNKLWNLKNNITANIDYLSTEYQATHDILTELDNMINLDIDNSIVFQWWIKNENSINTINKLLKRLEN